MARNIPPLRLLVAAGLSLALALLLLVLLYITDMALTVWQKLVQAPPVFVIGYALFLVAVAAGGTYIIWRLARPRRTIPDTVAAPPPPTEDEVRREVASAQERGVDASASVAEISDLEQRRASGEVHVALFGEVSTGKSALVNALVPAASTRVDPRSGTTRRIERHTWQSPAGDRLVLVDMPGVNEPDGTLTELSTDEALRAHVVVYVCDGDLSRDQYGELRNLAAFGKPLIVALNKVDRYSPEDLERITARIRERTGSHAGVEVVQVSAGSEQEVTVVHADGREEIRRRRLPANVDTLRDALQRRIDHDGEVLDELRDAAVFVLAKRKLDQTLKTHRDEASRRVVTSYTRKAVVGAMAAVSPGMDIIIQGYLGVGMVKELCKIYDVPVREVEIDRVLKNATGRAGKALPVALAIAGNSLKAFPGAGTLAGGVTHAVAYGLMFDSLGQAISRTLETRGALPPAVVSRTLEEVLGEELETRARRLAKVALQKTERTDKAAGNG
ncbi:MAG: GTPase [Gammaproteobacteria bacterium]|nr:GTPase [Gammaproteobacteria bacterium]